MPKSSATDYLRRARDFAVLADKKLGDEKKRLMDIAKPWLRRAGDAAVSAGKSSIVNASPPDSSWADLYGPFLQSERDKRHARIALWVVAFVSPLFVAWLIGPKLLQDEWWKPARAYLPQLGYYWADLNVQQVPCSGWFSFDYGYSVHYQVQKGEKLRNGYLCRKFGDEDWMWYPT